MVAKSTKPKHTPGPWRLNGFQVERCSGIARTIATVAPMRRLGTDYAANSHDEAARNAKLIAAAPAMLEALEAIALFVHAPEHRGVTLSEAIQAMSAIAENVINIATVEI